MGEKHEGAQGRRGEASEPRIAPGGEGPSSLPARADGFFDPHRRRVALAVTMICAALVAVLALSAVAQARSAGQDPADQGQASEQGQVDGGTGQAGDSAGSATADGTTSTDASSSTTPAGPSGASSSAAAASPPPAVVPAAPATRIHVTVSVSSSVVGNPVSTCATVVLDQGATAYDALVATGLAVNAKNTQYGIYVNAIGGLAEKQQGAASGWLYAVDGTTPGTSCSSCVLSDGDAVAWTYTTGS